MKPGIYLAKVWFDDDVVELKIDVSDGQSYFSNRVYVAYSALIDVAAKLEVFKDYIYGGLLDIQFAEFGFEYAKGGFHARLHFQRPGKLYITCKQQSEFEDFAVINVASEATLYLKTEPALLDNFIEEMKSLNAKKSVEAHLEAI